MKAFGPDGQLRRKRFSQESARFLAQVKAVIPQWDRRGKQIICIHFYGESRTPVKNRLKAGTIYTYQEQVADRKAWTHKRLPYRAMDASTGHIETPEVIDSHIRSLFCAVALSIMCNGTKHVTATKAQVISIEVGRKKTRIKGISRPPAEVIAFPVAA